MSDPNKEIEDLKKEAARHAREEARKRLAAKHEAELSSGAQEEKEKALPKGAEINIQEAKRHAAAAAKAKAAALAK
ncbi:NADH-quinone oxidoreductase subunit C, partial [Bacillus cereus]